MIQILKKLFKALLQNLKAPRREIPVVPKKYKKNRKYKKSPESVRFVM